MSASNRYRNTSRAICLAVFFAGSGFPLTALCVALPASGKNTSASSDAQRVKSRQKQPTASTLMRLAVEPVKDNPKLPRVLLIGDSITMGYTVLLRESLKDKANVHFPIENCHTSRQILERLDVYLGDKPWDVIQFNCGIHDITLKDETGQSIKLGQQGKVWVPVDEYRANLEKIVARLQKTGATLVWCSTTPVADGLPHRKPADITRYNDVAKDIMSRHQIRVSDLYAAVERSGKPKFRDGVHFTLEGCQEMANYLSRPIAEALVERAKQRSHP